MCAKLRFVARPFLGIGRHIRVAVSQPCRFTFEPWSEKNHRVRQSKFCMHTKMSGVDLKENKNKRPARSRNGTNTTPSCDTFTYVPVAPHEVFERRHVTHMVLQRTED
ncbi:hypothetical protein PHSY_004946 [Pseudozyma hubeiensis SY62]|uniref:Uncharacterized protein n=1 Tax=Pseudozyma hubeiensis (strain SY62) TaxID=1305764 RepID=R9P7P0_PSEHS|nr:hypothetical protein PHSY_004946 [Pseudozyma hubeiensis SY62]GAC97361.1 hypothetical protein PHSY_004946 [Pseudozyma hubeiensis SY62]